MRRRRPRRPDVPSRRASCRCPVERLSSGNALEDRELQRRIDARRFPTIDGELTDAAATPARDGRYVVRGDLTFRGVTNTLRGRDDDRPTSTTARCGSRAESTFDIRDFGMEPPRILMLTVAPEVDGHASTIVAEKEG